VSDPEILSPRSAGRFRTAAIGDGWVLLLDRDQAHGTVDGEEWRSFELPGAGPRKLFAMQAGAVAATPNAIWYWPAGGASWIRHPRWRKDDGAARLEGYSPSVVASGGLVLDYEEAPSPDWDHLVVDVYLVTPSGLELVVHELRVPGSSLLGAGVAPDGELAVLIYEGTQRVGRHDRLASLPTAESRIVERGEQLWQVDLTDGRTTRVGLGPVSAVWIGPAQAFSAGDRARARRLLSGLRAARDLGGPGRYLEVFGPVRFASGREVVATSAGLMVLPEREPDPRSVGSDSASPWIVPPTPGELAWRLWAFGGGASEGAIDALLDGRSPEMLAEALALYVPNPLDDLFEHSRTKRHGRIAAECARVVRLLCARTSTDGLELARTFGDDPVAAARALAFAAVPSVGASGALERARWGARSVGPGGEADEERTRAVAALAIERLRDPDPDVRAFAAGACAALQRGEAAPGLTRLLEDEHDVVFHAALEALLELPSPLPAAAADAARKRLYDRPLGLWATVKVIQLIGRADKASEVENLIAFVADARWRVRAPVWLALRRLSDRSPRECALSFFDASTMALASFLLAPRDPLTKVPLDYLDEAPNRFLPDRIGRAARLTDGDDGSLSRPGRTEAPFGLLAFFVDTLSTRLIIEAGGLTRAARLAPFDEGALEPVYERLRDLPGGGAFPEWDVLRVSGSSDEADARERLSALAEALDGCDGELAARLRIRAELLAPAGERTEALRGALEPALQGLSAAFVLLAADPAAGRSDLEARFCSRSGGDWPVAIPLFVATLDEPRAAAFLARFLACREVRLDVRYEVASLLEKRWAGVDSAREAALGVLGEFAASRNASTGRRVEAAVTSARYGATGPLRELSAERGRAEIDAKQSELLDRALAEAGDEAALERLRPEEPADLKGLSLRALAASGSLEDVPLLELAKDLYDLDATVVEAAITAIRARSEGKPAV
jgi:hypothetical protein